MVFLELLSVKTVKKVWSCVWVFHLNVNFDVYNGHPPLLLVRMMMAMMLTVLRMPTMALVTHLHV